MRTESQIRTNFNFEIEKREESSNSLPTLRGYAALFDSKTDLGLWTESVARGAFTQSLQRKDDVRCLFNHDPSEILARYPKTMQLGEDERGLWCEFTPANTQRGRDLVEMIQRGDITQMSFGFIIEEEKADFKGEKPHFTILRAKLFDVSPVTFPAYEDTEISIARNKPTEEELNRRLANFLSVRAEAEARQRDIDLLKLV